MRLSFAFLAYSGLKMEIGFSENRKNAITNLLAI